MSITALLQSLTCADYFVSSVLLIHASFRLGSIRFDSTTVSSSRCQIKRIKQSQFYLAALVIYPVYFLCLPLYVLSRLHGNIFFALHYTRSSLLLLLVLFLSSPLFASLFAPSRNLQSMFSLLLYLPLLNLVTLLITHCCSMRKLLAFTRSCFQASRQSDHFLHQATFSSLLPVGVRIIALISGCFAHRSHCNHVNITSSCFSCFISKSSSLFICIVLHSTLFAT